MSTCKVTSEISIHNLDQVAPTKFTPGVSPRAARALQESTPGLRTPKANPGRRPQSPSRGVSPQSGPPPTLRQRPQQVQLEQQQRPPSAARPQLCRPPARARPGGLGRRSQPGALGVAVVAGPALPRPPGPRTLRGRRTAAARHGGPGAGHAAEPPPPGAAGRAGRAGARSPAEAAAGAEGRRPGSDGARAGPRRSCQRAGEMPGTSPWLLAAAQRRAPQRSLRGAEQNASAAASASAAAAPARR